MVRRHPRGDRVQLPPANQAKLNRLAAAMHRGEVGLTAELGGVEVRVPQEVLRGHWMTVKGDGATEAEREEGAYVVEVNEDREEIGPRYYRPRIWIPPERRSGH